jgi:hypothetical protein
LRHQPLTHKIVSGLVFMVVRPPLS